VGPGGKKLSDDSRLETLLNQTEGSSQAGTTGTNHNSIVLVVND